MDKRIAVVIGVGPPLGLGAAVARRFAREGLHVIVASRTADRLERLVTEIQNSGGTAQAVQTDVTIETDVIRLFDIATVNAGMLELVAYNVGSNAMVPFLEITSDLMEHLWRQNALGGFLVGREAVRHMLRRRQGTIIFTGATASLRARPPFTAFASAKASLRAIAQGMAREFGPQGLHVAHVVIDGVIGGEYARTSFPELVQAKGEDGLLAPEAIADAYWALHRQPPSAWTHELDLRPYREPF